MRERAAVHLKSKRKRVETKQGIWQDVERLRESEEEQIQDYVVVQRRHGKGKKAEEDILVSIEDFGTEQSGLRRNVQYKPRLSISADNGDSRKSDHEASSSQNENHIPSAALICSACGAPFDTSKLGHKSELKYSMEMDPQQEEEIYRVEKQDEEHICIDARTALIIPLSWTEFKAGFPTGDNDKDVHYWVDVLLSRHFIGQDGATYRMWKITEKLPEEVNQLSPTFKNLAGFIPKPQNRKGHQQQKKLNTWRCWRLHLRKKAMKTFFPNPTLWGVQRSPNDPTKFYRVPRSVRFESVQLVLYPLSCGLLVFNIDWMCASPQTTSVKEIRTWLYLAKFLQKVKNVVDGWTFGISSHNRKSNPKQKKAKKRKKRRRKSNRI